MVVFLSNLTHRVVFHVVAHNVCSQKAIKKTGAVYSHQEWGGFSPARPIEHCII